jgi:hypothetical protein
MVCLRRDTSSVFPHIHKLSGVDPTESLNLCD